jgi:hypothetical protein
MEEEEDPVWEQFLKDLADDPPPPVWEQIQRSVWEQLKDKD